MIENKSDAKPVLVDMKKDTLTEEQKIVYKELARQLQAARFDAMENQREQEKNDEANKKNSEFKQALELFKKRIDDKQSINAQTLPATLVWDLIELSALWGTIMQHNFDVKFQELKTDLYIAAQGGSIIAGLAVSLPKKMRELIHNNLSLDAIGRGIYGDGALALPKLSYYFGLDEKGHLKINPVSQDNSDDFTNPFQFKFANQDELERLNSKINMCGIDWLKGKGYIWDQNDGCFYKEANGSQPSQERERLTQEALVGLATNPNDGLDVYLQTSCKVLFQLKPKVLNEATESPSLRP